MQRERACALPFLTAPAQVFAVVFETNIFNKDYRPVGIQRNTVGNLNSERRLLKFAADDIIIAAVSFLSAVLLTQNRYLRPIARQPPTAEDRKI